MVIHLYAVCWNAGQLLPLFFKHYLPFVDEFTFYDNMSTDNTREIICANRNSRLIDFDTKGRTDEVRLRDMKNTIYHRSRGVADYVIIADVDEFLYHPDVSEVLNCYKRAGITLPRIEGFNMVAFSSPSKERRITEQVRRGRYSPRYSKRCIFDPALDISYNIGSHYCNPIGHIKESPHADLKLLHYHYLGFGATWAKYNSYRKRMIEEQVQVFGGKFPFNRAIMAARFMKNWLMARRII